MRRLKNLYHLCLAWWGDWYYGHPSRHITVIGVTGTKGKSTTVELLSSVLEASGKKTAFLSSVHIKVAGVYQRNNTGNTMPGRLFVQRWLRDAVRSGCEYAILEVTSQGVTQFRHRYIDFDVGALTCLHPEHIEAHGSYEAYREAKVQFFRDAAKYSRKKRKAFFVNTDTGPDGQYFTQAILHPTGTAPRAKVIFYNREDFIRTVLGGDADQLGDWLSSGFNLENAATVASIAEWAGVSREEILRALADFKGVAGRMEAFSATTKSSGGSFTVLVDYAHTPGSFEALFTDLRKRVSGKGRIIAVFGSYGEGRDKWKRPELGAIAGRLCDESILTNEGPGEEDPRAIVDAIAAGLSSGAKHRIILDRREAIRAALESAHAGDIVALVGKGHESYINLGKKGKIDWNERRVAEELLAELSA